MILEQLAVSQSCTRRWSLFRDLIRYSRWGFRTVGLCREKVAETGVDETADLLHEMQMTASSLGCAGGFTGSDGRSHSLAIEDGLQAIADAAALGAPVLILHTGGPNGHTGSHLRRLLHSALRELVPVAADREVRLALEPLPVSCGNRVDFTRRIGDAAELLADWSPQWVGLVADLHSLAQDPAAVRLIPRLLPRIALLQLADSRFDRNGVPTRCLPGTGTTPIWSWLKLLECLQYRGPVELELHGHEFDSLGPDDLLLACREFLQLPADSAVASRTDHVRQSANAPVPRRRGV